MLEPSTHPLAIIEYMQLKGVRVDTAREEAAAHEGSLLRDLTTAGRTWEMMRHPSTGAWLFSRRALDAWWARASFPLLALSANRWAGPPADGTADGEGVSQDTVPLTLADFLVLKGMDGFSAPSIAEEHERRLVETLAIQGDERGSCLAPLGRSRVFVRRVLHRWWEQNRVRLLSLPRVGPV